MIDQKGIEKTTLMTIRNQFPFLSQQINEKEIVYLDNAATTQKPQAVIDSLDQYYQELNSNVHRGVHQFSQKATLAFEDARKKVASYINATEDEFVFTKGTTDGINLVASSLGQGHFKQGDRILITEMEHHSNMVPWQVLADQLGLELEYLTVNANGELDENEWSTKATSNTALLAMTHASNTLGTVNRVKYWIQLAKEKGIPVLLDGAQAVPHMKVDVKDLGCDFYAFSAHKLYGPTGIGGLFIHADWMQKMLPYQTGGGMIKEVTFEKTTFESGPAKFEAGTPDIAGAIAFGTTIDFLNTLNWDDLIANEKYLLHFTSEHLKEIPGLKIIGNAREKVSVISFVFEDIHSFDVGTLLDQMGIAVRTGHHCTQPLLRKFDLSGTVRASFGIYNTEEEAMRLIDAVGRAVKMLRGE